MTKDGSASEIDVVGASTEAMPDDDASNNAPALNVRAVLEASVVAGVVFLALEIVASLFGAASPMGPARASLKGLAGFETGPSSVAGMTGTLLVHFGLSFATTLVLALLVRRWKTYVACTLGLAFGGFLYTANVILLSAVSPGASLGTGLGLIVNYALYGAVAAWLYKVRQ